MCQGIYPCKKCGQSKPPMSIKIMLDLPPPEYREPPKKEEHKPSIEEEVREALEKIDSGYESHVEWLMIGGLYEKLKQLAHPSPRARALIEMIEPVLAKYGYHKVAPNPKS